MKTKELLKRMTDEERMLHNKVQFIKNQCISRVESLFVQHFQYAGIDDLTELVESFDEISSTQEYDTRVDDLIYDLVTNFKFNTNHKGEVQMSKVVNKFSMRGE